MQIRLANLPQDYSAIADVLQDESPGWGDGVEEMAYADASRPAHHHHATFVAEVSEGESLPGGFVEQTTSRNVPLPEGVPGALIVGVAFVEQHSLAYHPHKFEINLRVRPAWQGQGVGKALYQAVLDHLQPLAPQELVAQVWHALPRPIRFLSDRGFVEAWRRVDWELETADFDFTPYAGVEEALAAQGITIHTYAQLMVNPTFVPDLLRKFYELDTHLWQSIPYGQPVVPRSFEEFVAQEVNHPKFIADACFMAIKAGESKVGELIGYSNLSAGDEGFNIEMTGVLSTYRKLGVATLLKLYGIRYAQAHGQRRLDAQNDSINEAMITLNQKLGFVQIGSTLRFVKKIE